MVKIILGLLFIVAGVTSTGIRQMLGEHTEVIGRCIDMKTQANWIETITF